MLFVWGRQALIDRAIAARQHTTVGTITGHEPSYHDRYFYTYAVSGQTFRHWQIPHRVTWHLGQKVVVYYDPQDHATSSLTDFSERSADATGPISLLLVLTVGLIGYILYEARHQARAMDRTRIPDDP
ncbi:MAG TPA: DUF3592 domain-containing protein, partial [Gemmatimonadaceae bacterium]|nr:DUF3592 domain-containing protein [Gemmatimonadaceae bacterium]